MLLRRIVSVVGIALAMGAALARPARAEQGFQLDVYEPTPAGEWFFAVEHPWYSSTRLLAAGLTLDYEHDPLLSGPRDANGSFVPGRTIAVVEHGLVLHVDVAASFLDRVLLSATLPLTLVESGRAAAGAAPLDGVAVGDPRVGAMVRLLGQPERSPFSLSVGAHVWIPVGANGSHQGDTSVRVLARLVAGGVIADLVRWSVNAGYLYRPDGTLGTMTSAATVGQEVQLGAGAALVNAARTFSVGPELTLRGVVSNGHTFDKDGASLELLLGGHYLVADVLLLGIAGTLGLLSEPGTPDFRLLFRVAYAPVKRARAPLVLDADNDGIPDSEDACPTVPGVRTSDPRTNGCPPAPSDRDHDGVPDAKDLCPDEPMGAHPDPRRLGCPLRDRDHDGVPDDEDKCPDTPAGDHPDPARRGCPDKDTDGDGVYDHEDVCPTTPQGPYPDPARKGCPLPDRDCDTVPDAMDACPDVPGAPHPDPKKNGCPGLVLVETGRIRILQPVYFATNKAVVLPKSFPLLQAVANVLIVQPQIKKLAIEGHTDSRGSAQLNRDLSRRRAESVRQALMDRGVAVERLEAHGYGPDRPVATNKTAKGRASNRRVEFNILDPGAVGGGGAAGGGGGNATPPSYTTPGCPTPRGAHAPK